MQLNLKYHFEEVLQLKVLFVGPLPPPFGGVAVINRSLQEIDYEKYLVIACNTSNSNSRENLYSGISFLSVFRGIKKIKEIKSIISSDSPHIINLFVTSDIAILRELFYLKIMHKYRVPIIIHFHSKVAGEFALKPWRLKLVAWFFNRYANKIILLSNFHKSFFEQYFIKSKCEVLENFVNYLDFENNISDKGKDFLFVGRLTVEKGFFDLLKTVVLLKINNINCHIQVIGVAATEEQELEIMQFVKENSIEGYFTFNGALFGDRKYELFKKSCCLVFPSHFENSPVVIKEAIAAKMAILCSDIDANRNILAGRGNSSFFETGNEYDIAKKMQSLIADNTKLLQLCSASEKIKDYSVMAAKKKMIALFDEVTQE